MLTETDRKMGAVITRLIQKQNLTRNQAREALTAIVNDQVTAMHQGAFLAALAAKGETADEVAGTWEAIFHLDTTKVDLDTDMPLVENSGTGMDTFKTFNISTAASLIAAAGGIPMARHGARAITSACGTVDMAESLGVDVECSADLVAGSIRSSGIGLFNGMSPAIHPRALGRILSQICFGSTLNIAASLANPALPRIGVRGVYSRAMILPVVQVMKAVGYERALVLHGEIDDSDKGMDEASVSGTTWCAELDRNGSVREYTLTPGQLGLDRHDAAHLAPAPDRATESRRFVRLIQGRESGARSQSAVLNAGLIYYVSGRSDTIESGIQAAWKTLKQGGAFSALESWVKSQNRDPETGLKTLAQLT
ncbi:MAG: anthranilate phosphoribosyltransferase [Pseudomonadota bacterium]